MSSFMLSRVGVLALVLAGMAASSTAYGQEPETAKPASSASKEKLTGRLPPYYGQVVSKEQREKIYQVQAKFGDQIQKLRDQIAELEKSQMEEVVAVLSPEQQAQVAKLVADAKSRRSKKATTEPTEDPAG